ncbi:MAG: hypothetical protein ACN0LA_06870, partial [Candidatus Longimicrobiales bacterium M2_2A_002]
MNSSDPGWRHSVAHHPHRSRMACGDDVENLYLADLIGFDPDPVVLAVNNRRPEPPRTAGLAHRDAPGEDAPGPHTDLDPRTLMNDTTLARLE